MSNVICECGHPAGDHSELGCEADVSKDTDEVLEFCHCDLTKYEVHAKNKAAKLDGLKLAAENLLSQMKAVYESPEYRAVWETHQLCYGPYKGPTWIVEQDALRAELDKLK